VAHETGGTRGGDEAVEEAIVRALRSPAVNRAMERAMVDYATTVELNRDEVAQVVKRALESEAAEEIWGEVLASRELQMLIKRIADAPELRAALAAQGAGLITDIGVRLTTLTERFDDALERMVRPHEKEDTETNQAGFATRLVAAAVDLGLLFVAYSLASGILASVISFTFGTQLSGLGAAALGVVAFLVGGTYFAIFWTLAGQTPGMRFLAIRVTYGDAHRLRFGRSIRRVLAVVVSLLPLGLGYFAILRDPSRRAWYDRMTGTEVIYDDVNRGGAYSAGDSSGAGRAGGGRAAQKGLGG
jgi:uncharacterized RDD family membrane protein YckC